MRNITRFRTPAAVIALAGQLLAGGFYLQIGNPEASPEAVKAKAVLTIKATGCHQPETAQITAMAIGVVNGKRQGIPLKVTALSEPGMFALTQQWPVEGKWVIDVTARDIDGRFTYALIKAGPQGLDRYHAKSDMKKFPPAAIEAMLK